MYAAIFLPSISESVTPFEGFGAKAGLVAITFFFLHAVTLGQAPAEGCFGIFGGFLIDVRLKWAIVSRTREFK